MKLIFIGVLLVVVNAMGGVAANLEASYMVQIFLYDAGRIITNVVLILVILPYVKESKAKRMLWTACLGLQAVNALHLIVYDLQVSLTVAILWTMISIVGIGIAFTKL